VISNGRTYEYDASETGADDGASIIEDTEGNKFVWVKMFREVLTANRTYYVRSDGSNSNTGLANTAGGAFLTILKAWQVATSLDFNGFNVTIKCTGTFTAGTGPTALMWVGGGSLIFEGDTATPANATINASADSFNFVTALAGPIYIRGFKFSSSVNTTAAVALGAPGTIYTGQNEWAGQPTGGFVCVINARAPGALIILNTAWVISGGGNGFVLANVSANIVQYNVTHTVIGTPNFSWNFAFAGSQSTISGACTYSGAATGKRYVAQLNGIIQVGGSSTFFPGSIAGTTATQGQYV
jgi:hypothetical protein